MFLPQRSLPASSAHGAWGVVVPQLNSRPSTPSSAAKPSPPSSFRPPTDSLSHPPLSPNTQPQNLQPQPGGLLSAHRYTRPTSSTIYGRCCCPRHPLTPPLLTRHSHTLFPFTSRLNPSRFSQRVTGRSKPGKFVSSGHLRGLLDRWQTHAPAQQQQQQFSIMPRFALKLATASLPSRMSPLLHCDVCAKYHRSQL
jgi:hypothetical protein